ncbi:MAG: ral stress protein CsbD [Gammaproteobacteria bacterium]|nr:ral stress protein CsbD [Gammaproteobacteria bacterium]
MGINKDQVEGRVKEGVGKAQEVGGRVTGNRTQEAKGALKKNIGAAQAKVGDVTEQVKDSVKDAEKEADRESRDHH